MTRRRRALQSDDEISSGNGAQRNCCPVQHRVGRYCSFQKSWTRCSSLTKNMKSFPP